MNPSPDHEQQLADAIVERFIARCRRLWPGCVVTVRRPIKQPPAQQDNGKGSANDRQ
jgi:hypothetical protein